MLSLNDIWDIILRIKNQTWFDELMLEKDYYITLFFKELENFKNNWLVFKWWTCLNKIYFWFYRLSEDIDFSVTGSKSIISMTKKEKSKRLNEIHEILDICFEKIWFKENRERNINKLWEYRCKHNNAQMMRLYYEKESIFNWKITIQIEISMRKNPFQPKLLNLQHLFFDEFWEDYINWWKNIQVLTYNLNEVISEKLRCTYWRLWKDLEKNIITKVAIRDYFDIYYFIRKYWFESELFEKKFWFSKFDSNIFLNLFLYKNLQDFREKHISKDVLFEKEREYLKNEVISKKKDLNIVLSKNDIEKDFFKTWIDVVLDFIQWMQTNLKVYINNKYNLNFSLDTHIDEYLKKLVEMNIKVEIQ